MLSQLIELTGRSARLPAERRRRRDRLRAGLRRHVRRRDPRQKEQLEKRIGQLAQEIDSLTAQREAKARELKLVREELARQAHQKLEGASAFRRAGMSPRFNARNNCTPAPL